MICSNSEMVLRLRGRSENVLMGARIRRNERILGVAWMMIE
jgi:hypothetical protein